MKKRLPVGFCRRAFTLMEILLALAVSAIVLSVVTTVFFSALQLRNRTAHSFDEILPLQHALDVIKRDMVASMPPGGTFAGTFQTTPALGSSSPMDLFANGQPVGPIFNAASGMVSEFSSFADVQKVAYYLVNPTNTDVLGRDLVRVVSRNLLPTAVEEASSQWLMGGVETVEFQYFDGSSWMDTWDGTTSSNLPPAVKVRIAPAIEGNRENPYILSPIEMVIPIVAQARTSATPSSGGTP